MAKKRGNNQKRRKGGKTRTTVRSVYTAVQKYPRGSGATVREIHRIISKADKGRSKRTLSSVKLAISRAVKKGNIRAPKGWAGFRGIQLNEEPARSQSTRRDRKPRKGGSVKPSSRRSAHRPSQSRHGKQKPKSGSRRPSKGRAGQKPAAGTSHSLSQDLRSRSRGAQNLQPGAGGGTGSRSRLRKSERGGRGRSQWRRKVRGVGASNSNNSCPADTSDNYNDGQDDDKECSSSLWPVNTCVIS